MLNLPRTSLARSRDAENRARALLPALADHVSKRRDTGRGSRQAKHSRCVNQFESRFQVEASNAVTRSRNPRFDIAGSIPIPFDRAGLSVYSHSTGPFEPSYRYGRDFSKTDYSRRGNCTPILRLQARSVRHNLGIIRDLASLTGVENRRDKPDESTEESQVLIADPMTNELAAAIRVPARGMANRKPFGRGPQALRRGDPTKYVKSGRYCTGCAWFFGSSRVRPRAPPDRRRAGMPRRPFRPVSPEALEQALPCGLPRMPCQVQSAMVGAKRARGLVLV